MNYIVFDLEFNQPLSYEQLILDPFPFYFEVIQIGAVKMDESYKIKETIDIQVKPYYYKTIGEAAKKRISLYSNRYQQLMAFPQAYDAFLDFCGEEYCLFTWGDADVNVFNKNALIHRMQPINNVTCYDVQKIFYEYFGGDKKQIGLYDALEKLKLERYTAHNAFNDAYSTAEVLSKLKVNFFKKDCRVASEPQEKCGLYLSEECLSKNDAIQMAKEHKVACSCGAGMGVDRLIVLGKIKAISAVRCECEREYFLVVKFSKTKDKKKINLQCYKWNMSEELKCFYTKQRSVDDAITEYAKTHSRKYKIQNGNNE